MQFAIRGHDERETIWNSRDGAPLCSIPARSGLGELVHHQGFEKTYAPQHVPAIGDRIIVDVTEVRARQMTEERVARWELRESEDRVPPGMPLLRKLFRSRTECVRAIFEATVAPDIAVVTAGYLERLLAIREGFVAPAPRAAAPKMPTRPKRENPLVQALWLGKVSGRHKPPAQMMEIIGRLSVAEFVRAMAWIEDLDDEQLLESELGNNLCVYTMRCVDNSFGSAPRVYYESTLSNEEDPNQYYIFGEPRIFYATEEEARSGHAAMVERVQRALNDRRN
jgi:hypothetical protein